MIKPAPGTLKKRFSSVLLKWNKEKNVREMPWKGEKDPYKIWLSEIILQQTRVEQGWTYYRNFVKTYPTIHHLANAPEREVFKLWEGLGYYTRCRNLLATAKYISKELSGSFPDQYDEIKKLKGVGPYTAAAISSFAYNLPYAVVDGNVFRVLSRLFGLSVPVDTVAGKKIFTQLAEELLDKKQPGVYNQAIMDFGAVICKPALPLCFQCPFQKYCFAFLNDKIDQLPVKEKKTAIRKRWFYYVIPEYKDQVAIRKRTGKDIWEDLHEFQLIESAVELSREELWKELAKKNWFAPGSYELVTISPLSKQQLSHQLIAGRFIRVKLARKPAPKNNWFWIRRDQTAGYAFPGFINQWLRREAEQQAIF